MNLIKPDVYMISINLKDAFFSVAILMDHQKYLKFLFDSSFSICMYVQWIWQ